MSWLAVGALAGVVWLLNTQQTQQIVKTDARIDDARELPLDLGAHQNQLQQLGLSGIPNLFETDSERAVDKFRDFVDSRIAVDDANNAASNILLNNRHNETILAATKTRININNLG
jgi:hypothetical protein